MHITVASKAKMIKLVRRLIRWYKVITDTNWFVAKADFSNAWPQKIIKKTRDSNTTPRYNVRLNTLLPENQAGGGYFR